MKIILTPRKGQAIIVHVEVLEVWPESSRAILMEKFKQFQKTFNLLSGYTIEVKDE